MPFVFRLRDEKSRRDWWKLPSDKEGAVVTGLVQALREQYLPIVDKYRDPWSVEEWPDAWNGIHLAEGVAYGNVLKGDPAAARRWLMRTRQFGTNDGRDWAREVALRAQQVQETLDSAEAEAVALLKAWAELTTTNLRELLSPRS